MGVGICKSTTDNHQLKDSQLSSMQIQGVDFFHNVYKMHRP